MYDRPVWNRRATLRRAPPGGLRDKLVLTYNNTGLTDGVGAQLHRIYGIWAISRRFDLPYLHSPITRVDYQGLGALEANASDPTYHSEFNDVFHIDSDPVPHEDFFTINLGNIYPGQIRLFPILVDRGRTLGKPALVRVNFPHGIGDRFPDCYEACKEISPFESSDRDGRMLRVAVHVRRGDLMFVDSNRLLPNEYFINVAGGVARVLDALKIEYQLELWTEVPTGDVTVYPDNHGVIGRITDSVLITPDMYRLDDFDVLPNLVRCVNGKTIDCLRQLATADILIMSRSSFSYVAAVLNRNGIVMYHPFWHQPLSSWMTVQPDGSFDWSALRQAVSAPNL
jgi:hypothetical protein